MKAKWRSFGSGSRYSPDWSSCLPSLRKLGRRRQQIAQMNSTPGTRRLNLESID